MTNSSHGAAARPVAKTLPNGDREWRLDGMLHRPGGKLAIEYAEGGGECWLHGEHLFTSPPPRREDWREVHGEPVMTVRPNGDREWRVEGKLHREDGPAVEYTDGGGEWWIHGINHREGGPAAVFCDGSWAWYRDGRLHRLDGPALLETGWGFCWALEGELFATEDAFLEALARRGSGTV
jgi:hypothetical protein